MSKKLIPFYKNTLFIFYSIFQYESRSVIHHIYICQCIGYVFRFAIRTSSRNHPKPFVVQKYWFMAFLYYTQIRNIKDVSYIHSQHSSPIIYMILAILLAGKRTNNEDKFNED